MTDHFLVGYINYTDIEKENFIIATGNKFPVLRSQINLGTSDEQESLIKFHLNDEKAEAFIPLAKSNFKCHS